MRKRKLSPTAKLSMAAPSVNVIAVVVLIPLVPFAVPPAVPAVAKLSASISVVPRSIAALHRHVPLVADAARQMILIVRPPLE